MTNAAGASVQTQSGTLSFASGAVVSNGTFDTAACHAEAMGQEAHPWEPLLTALTQGERRLAEAAE